MFCVLGQDVNLTNTSFFFARSFDCAEAVSQSTTAGAKSCNVGWCQGLKCSHKVFGSRSVAATRSVKKRKRLTQGRCEQSATRQKCSREFNSECLTPFPPWFHFKAPRSAARQRLRACWSRGHIPHVHGRLSSRAAFPSPYLSDANTPTPNSHKHTHTEKTPQQPHAVRPPWGDF